MSSAESPQIDLLLEWRQERSRSGWAAVYGAAVLINFLFIFLLTYLPALPESPTVRTRVVWDRTPIYLPRDLLTQKAPNRQQIAKQIDLADLKATKALPRPASTPGSNRKRREIPAPTPKQQVAKNAPQIAAELPKAVPTPGTPNGMIAHVPPPPVPSKNPFQEVGSNAPNSPEQPKLAPPKSGVEAAIDGLARDANSSRTVITDDNATRTMPGGLGSSGSTPAQHAAIELKSDPNGADMKPYLIRILSIVRANWRTVTPESVRLGTRRGCTVMEFAIDRNGSIPKMVVADSSGSDPLDRAAAAGLMMSNPLPPLPSDYRGLQMRLAFSFSYNLPKGSCGG